MSDIECSGEKLDKIDELRNRFNISYSAAKKALEDNNWDLVETLIYLEEKEEQEEIRGKTYKEEFKVNSGEVISKIKEIIHQGNVNKIRVKNDGKVLVDIPVGLGAIGALMLPHLTVLTVLVAMFKDCTLEVFRDDEETDDLYN
ncbi:DUF4342 domain-containing protein [Selenomonadales bacterium OttesenSCG-928-I06]|nr:DUF4342 domain-containing protein [Selenomonadales bacterium OttesenSCG-928-I06]